MNTTLNTPNNNNFEENFNSVVNICSNDFSHIDLIEFLKTGTDAQKQFAALDLKAVFSKEEAIILTSNLVGQDGKIREAVAFKVNELAQKNEFADYFIDEKIFDTLLSGLMDINGNVCRLIGCKWTGACAVEFEKYLCKNLPNKIEEILAEIKKMDENSKQYVISKRNFQLYWCLEALFNIIDKIEIEKIKNIIETTANFYDYTIREKTAKIVAKMDNSNLSEIKEKLRNDENYYVKRYMITK